MDNRPMPVLRWGLLAVALVMCAWFALGAIQTRDQDRAAALINTFVSPSPAVTEHILGLLDTAGTLNPDRNIDLLRAQALVRAKRVRAGIAAALSVARAEPHNANAWIVLGFAAQHDPTLARLAREQLQKLVPPVAPAP
jgi:hypothetical protein